MTEVRVPRAATLREGQSAVFPVEVDGRRREGFVLNYKGKLVAFLNECPHWAVELDLGDGHFYDAELDRVYCKNHGALFVLPSGDCETGPCLGRGLTPLTIRAEGDDVMVRA